MSTFRQSANYAWWETGRLGEGSFGTVYQGINTQDGKSVAIKTFKNPVTERELQVLQKLSQVDHDNIVKILAFEQEIGKDEKILVMELCAGGSLQTLLQYPENKNGLCEDDFLLVLEHLSAGLKELRNRGIAHRDLKPDNILKHVGKEGHVFFRLTDFGAARELEADETFHSFHGTQEYMHPNIFEQAILCKKTGNEVSAETDLWSIGVTLFQLLTGRLPFRPFQGRMNPQLMLQITSRKKFGVISVFQESENGPLISQRELFPPCKISVGLKQLVTPLLARLMETDVTKSLTYKSFFHEAEKILRREIVYIYQPRKVQNLRIYLDPEKHKSFDSFQALVQEQTKIHPQDQVLLFGEKNLRESCMIYEFSTVASKTSEKNPIVLCDYAVSFESHKCNLPDKDAELWQSTRLIANAKKRCRQQEQSSIDKKIEDGLLNCVKENLKRVKQLQELASSLFCSNDCISRAGISMASGRFIGVSGLLGFVACVEFVRRSKTIFMDMTFLNKAMQPMSDIAVHFAPNGVSSNPNQPLIFDTPLLPNQPLDLSLPLNSTGHVQKLDQVNSIGIAIKNNVGLLCFQPWVPMYVYFAEDGYMNESAFSQAWENIPKENQVQYNLTAAFQKTDAMVRQLEQNNVFTATSQETVFGHELHQTLKVTSGDGGVFVFIKANISHRTNCSTLTIKSDVRNVASEVFDAYEAILRK